MCVWRNNSRKDFFEKEPERMKQKGLTKLKRARDFLGVLVLVSGALSYDLEAISRAMCHVVDPVSRRRGGFRGLRTSKIMRK